MKNPIYLDYNATTPVDPEVANEMLPYIQNLFGNPSSSYAIGRTSKEAIIKARKQVAGLINAKPDEIVFTSCASESNNLAIHGFVLANRDKGKHIITSAVEHPAVTEVCKYLTTLGYEITYLPVDSFGRVNPVDVEKAIRPDTALITIMHANNEVGTIQPISEITAIARKNNITFHTDASQSVGKIDTDVTKLGVDLLTIAGHKLYAPKGIGALYIKQGVKIENLFHGASQEKGIRPGTENVSHIVGLGKACEIAKRDFDKNSLNMLTMRDRLLNGLKNNLGDKVKVNVNLQNCLPNTLSVAFDNVEAHTLASVISKEIFISTGSACHADSIEISSVLKAMNINIKTAAGTVRISTGKYTTTEEIDYAVKAISEAVKKLS
ncbi:MAG TPA: cysteine desulfurase NifS [Marinilabiliales bacterium]|nr:MAG: cysteine desulfurase NifS [Bacteroidetes bacterium GWA2_40_14]OFX71407.1 MAG: cysteine desulfurase NifS [Bacteroidetes bacterium GWD2_40_43]OFX91416.1 MAG: cysteine desulfurase NifS [Bacteroidetes bacterium GWE2_40_63]OFY19485.1 MAG: cysteine desulfurase NifS [Bacteroidetes bacterium GWF2_40_13]OFZ25634.1 MAG: cysteine desulfurase NifS [Bacteroidetes bacterium RIFOXYC2_FULL_40_12]HAM97715.1 cysteine desulfurase NifS [Marinilabiliales bacterium]